MKRQTLSPQAIPRQSKVTHLTVAPQMYEPLHGFRLIHKNQFVSRFSIGELVRLKEAGEWPAGLLHIPTMGADGTARVTGIAPPTDGDFLIAIDHSESIYDERLFELNVAEVISIAPAFDEAAFIEVITSCRRSIIFTLTRLVGNIDTAEELAQDAFLRAFEQRSQFRGESNLKTWVYRIAINLATHRLRWQKRQGYVSSLSEVHGAKEGEQPREYIPPDLLPIQDEQLITAEMREAVRRAVATLPGSIRETVALRYFGGMQYDEIAEAQQLSIGTVRSRLNRARPVLRGKLQAWGGER